MIVPFGAPHRAGYRRDARHTWGQKRRRWGRRSVSRCGEDTMSDEIRQPLEETPEVADAIEDDVAVDAFITGGGADRDTPEFLQPGEEPVVRTGADQPWDPEDLAVA